MAYGRKNYKKRKGARRPYRRVYKTKRIQKKATINTNVRKNLYFFKRRIAPGTQINLLASPNGTIQFALDNVPGVADFTAMFDQYQIAGVKTTFRLVLDPSAQSAGTSIYPHLYVRRDFDDTTTETIQSIAQDNRSKRFILLPNRARSIYMKPSVQAEYFNQSSGLTIKSPQWNKWIDCTSSNYTHLGLKWAIDTMGITMPLGTTMTIEYTYYLKMKNTR